MNHTSASGGPPPPLPPPHLAPLEQLEKERLARCKSEVLERLRVQLCRDLDPPTHFPRLRSRGVLTRDDQQLIDNMRRTETTSASVGKLLDILATKSDGFDALCYSLEKDRTQMHLLTALNIALEAVLQQQRGVSVGAWPVTPQPDLDSYLPLPPDPDDNPTPPCSIQVNGVEVSMAGVGGGAGVEGGLGEGSRVESGKNVKNGEGEGAGVGDGLGKGVGNEEGVEEGVGDEEGDDQDPSVSSLSSHSKKRSTDSNRRSSSDA